MISSVLAMLALCASLSLDLTSTAAHDAALRPQPALVLMRATVASPGGDSVPDRYARDEVNRVLGQDPKREQDKAKSFVAFVILPVSLAVLLAALMRRAQF